MDPLHQQIVSHNKVSNQIEDDMATDDLNAILQKDPGSRDKEETQIFVAFLGVLETHIKHGETLHVALEFRRLLRVSVMMDNLEIMPN